jgi:NADPH:quinone reductase-like Zn-dependent oxidoreductase
VLAAVHTSYGPPEVVTVADVPTPEAAPGGLLVEVHASTVNRTDCGFRAAKPWFIRAATGPRRPRARVLGTEFAGRVAAVGPGVTGFAVGERVFGFTGPPFGAHAEFLAIPASASLATVPDGLTYEQAAPATEGAHYALAMLTRAGVGKGQALLVNGATGAIGSAAVQLARQLGASVTAVCPGAHLDLVRGLGAERVIDAGAGDFTADGQRYDVVIDAVGKSSFGRCRRLLLPGGMYLSSDLGRLAQNPALALVAPLWPGRKVAFPIPRHDQAMVRSFARLLGAGRFRPLVDRVYPLEEIVEAYRYVESGRKVGNVVLAVRPG